MAYPDADRPGVDTNAYTNVMAAWTLCRAFDLMGDLPEARRAALCRRLAIDAAELALWDAVSRGLRIAFHDDGIISQFAGYRRLRPLDPDRLAGAAPGARVD
jgi:trehalose/maltose hydrolase-like predicted phosphorylase